MVTKIVWRFTAEKYSDGRIVVRTSGVGFQAFDLSSALSELTGAVQQPELPTQKVYIKPAA